MLFVIINEALLSAHSKNSHPHTLQGATEKQCAVVVSLEIAYAVYMQVQHVSFREKLMEHKMSLCGTRRTGDQTARREAHRAE